MKDKTNKKNLYLLLLFAGIMTITIISFAIHGYIAKKNQEQERKEQELAYKSQNIELPELSEMTENKKLGSNSARIKLYVISSFTCVPCAEFHKNTLPIIISDYVDTNKVQIIFYDMATDGASIEAAMLSRCVKNDSMYFKLKDSLYSGQINWNKDGITKRSLSGYGKMAGMNEATINACFKTEKLYNSIIKKSNDIRNKYDIDSVPAFVLVRGKRFYVVKDYPEVINAIANF